jgi:urease accessory protein
MGTTITTDALAFLLQISDSAFPTGGYAHSYGLEEMVHCGVVTNEKTLLEFLQNQIRPALVHNDLPLVREAHEAASSGRFETLVDIDSLAGALKLSSELREASRRVGTRRLATLLKVRTNPALAALSDAVTRGDAVGHHAVVFGCACIHLPVQDALAAYDYQTVAGFCTASLKLLRIGQEGVQRVLATCVVDTAGVVEQALAIPFDEIGWFDPVLDLASMRHEIANERLFIS